MSDPRPQQSFTVADLNTRGELQLKQTYGYAQLEQIPGAADLIGIFSGNLYRTPEEFETKLPPEGPTSLSFRWRCSSPTAGVASVRWGDRLASVSLIVSGISPEADRMTLEIFQKHLLRELHDTGVEPSFALLELTERPLVATLNFASPVQPNEQVIVALADRCFAAAFFRYHRLA